MKLKSLLFILLGIILMSFSMSKGLDKKVRKTVSETFDLEKFSLNPIIIDKSISSKLPSEFKDDNFFEINTSGNKIGYAYLGEAPSKTDTFIYLVILDQELVIMNSKVLVYREDYGGEIGSRRWLSQFNGKSKNDTLNYGDNIMAISGATISVKSMTHAVNNLLKSLSILNSNEIF